MEETKEKITASEKPNEKKKPGRKKKTTDSMKSVEAEIKQANDAAAADPKYQGKTRLQVKSAEILMIAASVLIGSFGIICIMIPNGLTCGGTAGLGRMIQDMTGWNYSVISYALAAVIIVIVWIALGLGEVRKILILSIAYPTVYALLEFTGYEFRCDDLFLDAVFCGVAFGICNGLTFKAGYSSGGADSIAKVIKYKKLQHLGLNDITFAINGIVVLASVFVFGINIALYALVTMFISMKVGDMIMCGFTDKLVQLSILTEAQEELADYVMHTLGRGVTSVVKVGEYTGGEKKQLQVLCSPREAFLIKRFLAEKDPRAFVTVLRVSSVWGVGRGFSDINDME